MREIKVGLLLPKSCAPAAIQLFSGAQFKRDQVNIGTDSVPDDASFYSIGFFFELKSKPNLHVDVSSYLSFFSLSLSPSHLVHFIRPSVMES